MNISMQQFNQAELDKLEKDDRLIKAEGLTIYVDGMILKMWKGKASKAYFHYRMSNQECIDKTINSHIDKAREDRIYKAELKAEKKAQLEKMKEEIQVGTLLHGSWGYDQTNCEFYQVISKKGCFVIIREICGKTVKDSEGFMCENLVPAKDSFTDAEPMRKKITHRGISMEYFSLSPCSEWDSFYSSHYA